MIAGYQKLLDTDNGVVHAEVTTAQPLDRAQTQALASALSEVSGGKTVDVNAKVDINFLVLDDIECEATQIDEMNSWMTYGESLHRAREFGVVLPSMDNIDYCQLSKENIKTIVQML